MREQVKDLRYYWVVLTGRCSLRTGTHRFGQTRRLGMDAVKGPYSQHYL
jgi:hypothetical protein